MIIAANFKTNHTRQSTKEYIKNVSAFICEKNIKHKVVILPAQSSLDDFSNFNHITIGAQNCYPVQNGSFSGEIGLEHLNEFNINTILIGHSERRHIFGETKEHCINKFNFFKEHNFEIIYCIGEPLNIKEKGKESVLEYNLNQLKGIDLTYKNLIIAYEPIWAIGTGVSAKIQDIDMVHSSLKKHFGSPLLYGGSVKAQNAHSILSLECVDGALIGSSSWKQESFCEILNII